MPNRYEGQFRVPLPKRNVKDEMAANQKRKDAQQMAQLLAMGLPIAGAVGGGLIGAAGGPMGIAAGMSTGGAVGGAAGQAAGQYFTNEGESAMDETRRREMERMALMQAIQGMRR